MKLFSWISVLVAVLFVGWWFWLDFCRPERVQLISRDQVISVPKHQATVRICFRLLANANSELVSVQADCSCAQIHGLPMSLRQGEVYQCFADVDLANIKLPSTKNFLFYVNPPDSRPIACVKFIEEAPNE